MKSLSESISRGANVFTATKDWLVRQGFLLLCVATLVLGMRVDPDVRAALLASFASFNKVRFLAS